METQIRYKELEYFYLDSQNPRLGSSTQIEHLSQDELFDLMQDWSLEELAISFIENGFWAHEAVLCIKEEIEGKENLVVVEGNRRIAALKRLKRTYDGEENSSKWLKLINNIKRPDELFCKVPYIQLNNRDAVNAFLGFRHVTGIKEWAPPEKAKFIAKLIDEKGYCYRTVMRKIGSNTPVVERNYIAQCILKQMKTIEDLSIKEVENRFSVLFLSLRSKDVQRFLGVEDKFGIEPRKVYPPIKEDKIKHLKDGNYIQ
ncbi:MAG: hypothetical protein OXH65_10040 [Paracoccaceae bacterium]|nr:hypothetical protein [Paracoccaceae bacterium]MDE2675436.1 hypothetical protein [Paracoccaceae bacterium]